MQTRKEPRWQGMPPIRIIRPWGSRAIAVRPLEPFPIVVIVHRMSGRTLPCDGPKCIFHHHNVPEEERLLCRVWQSAKMGLAILDLPPTQWEPLKEIVRCHGPLNTLILSLSRPGGKLNSRIALECLTNGLTPATTVAAPDLADLFDAVLSKNREDATQALRFGKSTF